VEQSESVLASDDVTKLLPALLSARKEITPVNKGGFNKFDKYAYAKLEDWHSAVMPALLTNGLLLTVSTATVTNLEPRQTKKGGTEHAIQVDCAVRLWHVSGQWIEVRGVGHGQDRADKGVYKALTGCAKYLYAQLFALPTTDDPERDEGVGETGPPRASTPDKKADEMEDLL